MYLTSISDSNSQIKIGGKYNVHLKLNLFYFFDPNVLISCVYASSNYDYLPFTTHYELLVCIFEGPDTLIKILKVSKSRKEQKESKY